MNERISSITKDGRALILACDQGFEHGPVDFNIKNIDPNYIFDIALEGEYTAIAVQAGLADKYYRGKYRQIPLIVKLNGKTRFDDKDPVSYQHTSVHYAAKLGASAVGYTIYLGSSKEQEMFVEFAKLTEEAHAMGLASVCWMYPRGVSVKDDLDTDLLAYGARIALELGADMVKLKFNGNVNAMQWVTKSAGDCKTVIAGGNKTSDEEFLKLVQHTLDSGAIGLAVGRNVWQHDNPLKITREIKKVIFKD